MGVVCGKIVFNLIIMQSNEEIAFEKQMVSSASKILNNDLLSPEKKIA